MGCQLQGVVSFHGLLQSEPTNVFRDPNFDGTVNMKGVADKHTKTCKVLIENAEHDHLVTQASAAEGNVAVIALSVPSD